MTGERTFYDFISLRVNKHLFDITNGREAILEHKQKLKGVEMFYKKDPAGYKAMRDGVRLKTLVWGERTLLCEFIIEKGKGLPSHTHPHEQTGYLISGRMRFTIESETFEVEPGDSWSIGGNVAHSAEALDESKGVEVFSPVREDYLP